MNANDGSFRGGEQLMAGRMNLGLFSAWAEQLVIVLLAFSLPFALIFAFAGLDPAANKDGDFKEDG